MNEHYEFIKLESDVPMRLRCIYLENMPNHWHKGIEIILVLSGSVDIVHGGEQSSLCEDDLLVINRKSIHSLSSAKGCSLVSLQIGTDELLGIENADDYFVCDSSKSNDKGGFYSIKRLIAELVKANSNENADNHYYNLSTLYAIYGELCKRFRPDEVARPKTEKYFKRLTSIVEYIEDHYKEGITLKDVARDQHLSVPYLSSFIEKYLGVSFLTYYNELRLERAVAGMLTSDRSIEEISLDNGFSDPRSFVKLFKKKYNELPSEYRKAHRSTRGGSSQELYYDINSDKGVVSKESNLALLAKYLSPPSDGSQDIAHTDKTEKLIIKEQINTSLVKKNLIHSFKTFTSVGRAKELLFADVQRMLTELQSNIGYEYIKFHGLISDDMHVYTEDEQGNPQYSFVLVDKALDFLLSIGLKPLIELSFMPKALAGENAREVYASPFYIGMPKDMEKWNDLISALVRHLIDRYTMRVVRTWLFTVWNEPDTSTSLFGFENDIDFYRLYEQTYRTVKGINKAFKFGSPSLIVTYNMNRIWLTRFIEWCKKNECVPDFMNLHFYDNDFSDESIHQHTPAHPAHGRLNMDPDSFKKRIASTKKEFAELGIGDLPVYLTEWNLTVSHRNLLNDTCFKSCYLTKNLLENYDLLDSFGYWVLTDFIEETQPSSEEFHGGIGLYTYSGIKKPHYFAFGFINRLGSRLIDSGDGYFITKSHAKIQIILYNYEHFNHLFAAGESYDMTFTKRYTPFSKLGRMSVSLGLTDINAKSCKLTEQIINQHYGSAFDEWVRMGAPRIDASMIDRISHASTPKMTTRIEEVKNGELTVRADLEPLEVRLIEIEY